MSCRQCEKVNKKCEKVANTRLYYNDRTKYKIVDNKIQRHWQLSLICTTMPHWQLSCVTKVDNRKKLTLVIPDRPWQAVACEGQRTDDYFESYNESAFSLELFWEQVPPLSNFGFWEKYWFLP
jgi:hypothetical protein